MSYNNTNKSYGFALFLIGCLFFIFGFITWSNSQLIPYFKIACELTDTQSYFVATAFFAAYFFMALPSAWILKKTGYQKGMSVGLFIMSFGAILFLPAASIRSYPLFLTGLFIIGTGLALLQTASNPYAAILGPMKSAATRITIMGICNKVAGILAVFILGSITLSNVDTLKAQLHHMNEAEKIERLNILISKVETPYLIISLVLLILGIVFYRLKLPEVNEEGTAEETTNTNDDNDRKIVKKKSIFHFPHLLLGVIAIFFYVGVEVISYDTFAGFGESLGYPLEVAKSFAKYTGYSLIAGYLLGLMVMPKLISQRTALIISVLLSMFFVFLSVFTEGTFAIVCFALLGFSNALMWPAIWPLSITGLGKFTKTGSALIIMGIVGGAVLPPLYAEFATYLGDKGCTNPLQVAYLIMIPCYLYILFFALRGYKIRKIR